MGCDIHEYLEFVTKDETNKEHVSYVGSFDLGRDYTLFALMAGVRYEHERMNGVQPISQPKGIPSNLSWLVMEKYGIYVSPDETEQAEWENHCSLSNALRWIADKSSDVLKGTAIKPEIVSGPDWHSASWLGTAELKEVARRYRTILSAPNSWFQSADQAIPEGAIVKNAETGWMARRGLIYVEIGERVPLEPYVGLDALIAAMEVFDTKGVARLTF